MIDNEQLIQRKQKLLDDRNKLAERLQLLRSEEQTIIQNLSAMNGAIQVLDEFIDSSGDTEVQND